MNPKIKAEAKKWILGHNFMRRSYNKGYFSPKIIGLRIVNYIFQRIFRINSECNFSVHFTSQIIAPQKIVLGSGVDNNFLLSGNCYVQALNGIIIGEGTLIGPGVKLVSANHDFQDISRVVKCRPIKIGKNCWLGANVVILPGVELGDNTIVGAGTTVNKSFINGNVMLISDRKLKNEKLLNKSCAPR